MTRSKSRLKRRRRPVAIVLIGKLIGYKLANSELVTKSVTFVRNVVSRYSLEGSSRPDMNKNCSQDDSPSQFPCKATASEGPSSSGQCCNSNINAVEKDVTCCPGPKGSPNANTGPRPRRLQRRKGIRYRRKNTHSPRCKWERSHQPKRTVPCRYKWRLGDRVRQKTQDRHSLATNDKLNEANTDQAKSKTPPEADNILNYRTRHQVMMAQVKESSQESKDTQSLPLGQEITKLDEKKTLVNERDRHEEKNTSLSLTQQSPIEGAPNEQEWPPLSKTREAQKIKAPMPDPVTRSPTKRWADIVGHPEEQSQCTSSLDIQTRSKKNKTFAEATRTLNISKSQLNATRPDILSTKKNHCSRPNIESKSKRNTDQLPSRVRGRPRKFLGDEIGKSKRDILKERLCQKRQQDGAASCTRRTLDRPNRTIQPSCVTAQCQSSSENCNEDCKIDKMPDVFIVQPARDEFPLRQFCSKKKTKMDFRNFGINRSNNLLDEPSTSKRLGSTLQGKLQIDLSEHLSSMSLRSRQDPLKGSSYKDHKRLWKKKVKSDSNQKIANLGRSRAREASSHSKDNGRKARDQIDVPQLKISKRYRELLRGGRNLSEMKSMSKQKQRAPEH